MVVEFLVQMEAVLSLGEEEEVNPTHLIVGKIELSMGPPCMAVRGLIVFKCIAVRKPNVLTPKIF